MALRPHKLLPIVSLLVTFGLFENLADAAGKKDKEATKLIAQAMDEDYLNVDFDKAEAKLKKALDACSKDACSPEVLAKVHVALATVHGVGQSKLDVAKADLVNAVKADPNVKLLDGLSTPELEAKLKEAQAEAGGGSATGGSSEGGSAGTGGSTGSGTPAPAGDFQHTPVSEQEVNYPVPVFAEVPAEVGATKVIVRYKAYGGTKWETLNLDKMEGGWGAEIPCDASSSAGELKYFIIGSDESGTPVVTAGSMKAPFKVPVKAKVADRPGLPGKPAPKRCIVKEDCPPGLPGCEGAAGGKTEGAICDESAECASGLGCESGVCTPNGDGPETPAGPGKHHVITVGAQFDLAYIGDGTNVCSAGSSANYVCTNASGAQFFGDPLNVKGTNGISGGLGLGGIRILAGYDYFFDFGLGLGARVGYAIGGPTLGDEQPAEGSGYPKGKSYLPVHAEARATWRFLHPAMQGGDFAPSVFLAGGLAQVNASVPVTVCDARAEAGDNPACPGETKVDAYQLAGTTFIGFGGGATYMFIDNFGLNLDLKFMVLFPTVGFVISPTLSPVVSF